MPFHQDALGFIKFPAALSTAAEKALENNSIWTGCGLKKRGIYKLVKEAAYKISAKHPDQTTQANMRDSECG